MVTKYHFSYFSEATITLATVRSEEFPFQSPNAERIRDLVVYFLGTEEKIAIQDFKAPGRTIYEIMIKVRVEKSW